MKLFRNIIKNDIRLPLVIITAMFVGIAAHGQALFNKFSFQDDISAFNSLGSTYESGRWFLGVLDTAVNILFGMRPYSLPCFCR